MSKIEEHCVTLQSEIHTPFLDIKFKIEKYTVISGVGINITPIHEKSSDVK